MADNSLKCPPLLVEIQNVDISTLDFQGGFGTGAPTKWRHVTFVEATTLFLYVGSTSGTVYLFSRESLDFLLMIPFKGGKVCNILASGNESEVAVASIRGLVSIYRMSPNMHLRQSHTASNRGFKHLYDINHHVNNEVTEIKWSPNGKFLYVGDNQGLISQTDMGSLEEFPRSPLPSRIILKLHWRILQMDCFFPFLAVSTMTSTYLCDLEKEDFTRIQSKTQQGGGKTDIKSAGLCIVCQEDKMVLMVGEVDSGCILRCGMDGCIISSRKVELSPGINNPVGCFDPKQSENFKQNCVSLPNLEGEPNFSPGKMSPTDDGEFVISVSSNRIFVCDVKSGKIVLWNEDFNRINSLKIIANYAFLWYANKLQVFALTQFRSYGKQLLKVGLRSVLENWISYAVYSIGYQNCNEEENNNSNAIKLFREMMSPVDEEEEFCQFVATCIPFHLTDPEVKRKKLEKESYDKKLQRFVKKLVDSIKIAVDGMHKRFSERTLSILIALSEFYTDLCHSSMQFYILPTNAEMSDLTLLQVLNVVHGFMKQPQLVHLRQDLCKYSLADRVLNGVIVPILKLLLYSKDETRTIEFNENENLHPFLRYANCPVSQDYFADLEISLQAIRYDALVADMIVLMLPLSGDKILYDHLKPLELECSLSKMFFTWLTIMNFFQDKIYSFPFSGLLKSIQTPILFDKLAAEIISSVYREVIFPRGDRLAQTQMIGHVNSFTHFVTFAILFSKCTEISKPLRVNLVLNLFPFKRGLRDDLFQKIIQLCTINPVLFRMYYKATLEDGKCYELCSCGIQVSYGSLEKDVAPFQRAIEEAVLHILVQYYFENQDESIGNGGKRSTIAPYPHPNSSQSQDNPLQTLVHIYSMKRSLILPYLESSLCDEILSDQMKIMMILRSGICAGLRHLRFNEENLTILGDALSRDDAFICSSCGDSLTKRKDSPHPRPPSLECMGVWMMENCDWDVGIFMKLLQKMCLNSKGQFSLRFYQFIVKMDALGGLGGNKKGRRNDDAGFGDLVSLSNLTCSFLH